VSITPFLARCTGYNIIKFVSDLTCLWFSPGTPVSSNNKTERNDIAEILLKVALSTINQPNQPSKLVLHEGRKLYYGYLG
jgi:hypothetical protein